MSAAVTRVDGVCGADAFAPLMPGLRMPAPGSLLHCVLRTMAREWSWHVERDGEWLASVPAHLKELLLVYLSRWHEGGVSLKDLKLLLGRPRAGEPDGSDGQVEREEAWSGNEGTANDAIWSLKQDLLTTKTSHISTLAPASRLAASHGEILSLC